MSFVRFRMFVYLFCSVTAPLLTQLNFGPAFGPQGTAIFSLARDSSGSLFAGAQGLFRSTNGGLTWTVVDAAVSVQSFAIGPTGTYFVGTSNGNVLRSTNGGASWSYGIGVFGPSVVFITFDASGYVYAGTPTAMFKSTNGGVNFSALGIPYNSMYDIFFNSNGMYLAATGAGIFASTDHGATWNFTNNGFQNVFGIEKTSSGVYFALSSQGVYKSTDNSLTWTNVREVYDGQRICLLDDTTLFVATYATGVLRSQNGGSSWDTVNTGLDVKYINTLMPLPNGSMMIGTALGVHVSTDRGASWTRRTTGLGFAQLRDLAVAPAGALYAAAYGGVHKSTDGGANWYLVNNGLGQTDMYGISVSADGVVTAGAGDGTYQSTDGGAQWTKISDNFYSRPRWGINGVGHIFLPQSNEGVYRSLDGGTAWSLVFPRGPESWPSQAAVNPIGHVFVTDQAGTIFMSRNNGRTWTTAGTLAVDRPEALVFDSLGFLYVPTTNDGIRRSIASTSPVPQANCFVLPELDAGRKRINRTHDTVVTVFNIGNSPLIVSNVSSNDSVFKVQTASLSIPPYSVKDDSIGFTLAALGYRDVKIFLDHNGTELHDTILVKTYGFGVPTVRFAADTIAFGSVDISEFRDTTVIIHNDGDDTLKITYAQFPHPSLSGKTQFPFIPQGASYVDSLRFVPTTSGIVQGSMVLYSNTEATTDSLFMSGSGHAIPILHVSNHRLDFGPVGPGKTGSKFFLIRNDGTAPLVVSPIATSDTTFRPSVDSVSIFPHTTSAVTVTYRPIDAGPDSAVLRLHNNSKVPIDSVVLVGVGDASLSAGETASVVSEFRLTQNYPNPFNPQTEIVFDVVTTGHVRINVIDLLGRTVSVLVDREMNSGTHRVTWSGAGLPGGIYFYRMEAGSFMQSRKMVLLK